MNLSEGFTVVIPARYGSTRLPGKALSDLGGKPMVVRTFEQASASAATAVVVATDDHRIESAVLAVGGTVCMTSPSHQSGTDRAAEVAATLGLSPQAIVVNVQGDEPFIPPGNISQVAENLAANPNMDMATLCEPLEPELLHDASAVKVVRAADGRALYFSRATIPWYRDAFAADSTRVPPDSLLRRHVGIYAYRVEFLARFVQLPPCELENTEALEQLRAIYHGAAIHVEDAREPPGPGIDTPEDLARAQARYAR
jgi:3-deoxy-manno-octulosonate cytidylyltransferase (CMP-KDO synthetase)